MECAVHLTEYTKSSQIEEEEAEKEDQREEEEGSDRDGVGAQRTMITMSTVEYGQGCNEGKEKKGNRGQEQ